MSTYNSKKVNNILQFIKASTQLAAHRNDQEIQEMEAHLKLNKPVSCACVNYVFN